MDNPYERHMEEARRMEAARHAARGTTGSALMAMINAQRAMGYDVDGTRTIAGAKAAYVRGAIEADELERRVERILRG